LGIGTPARLADSSENRPCAAAGGEHALHAQRQASGQEPHRIEEPLRRVGAADRVEIDHRFAQQAALTENGDHRIGNPTGTCGAEIVAEIGIDLALRERRRESGRAPCACTTVRSVWTMRSIFWRMLVESAARVDIGGGERRDGDRAGHGRGP
jgi:hypothetical protein